MATQAEGHALSADRALWVCDTCRLRKKGCDKQLPKCGYCAKRSLSCVYHDAPPSDKTEFSDPRAAVALLAADGRSSGRAGSTSSLSASASASTTLTGTQQSSSIYEMLSAGGGAGSSNLEDLLNREVTRVFQAGRLSLPDIAQRFFKGFHKWLPVVSPSRFHQVAAQATANSNGAASSPPPPPADFSLLVLAMCLVALPPAPEGSSPGLAQQQGVQPESLYLTVKVLFAQTQAVMCASTVLVQTGLIIAAYEYACQKLNAAYIAIGTCVRIAHALGLDKSGAVGAGAGGEGQQQEMELTQQMRQREDWNVWWGVVILERIILVEISHIHPQPAAELPTPDAALPSDLPPGSDAPQSPSNGYSRTQRAPESPFDGSSAEVDNFGRQAQAVYLLDRVIRISNAPSGTLSRHDDLEQLDADIQSFLGMVLEECERLKEFRCSVVATAIRCLFILHEKALAEENVTFGGPDHQRRKMASEAALDMATNMVTQAAQDHARHMPDGNGHNHNHSHSHSHAHDHNHGHSHEHSHSHAHEHSHDQSQENGHGDSHSHGHGQEHGQGHGDGNGHEHPVNGFPLCCVYSMKCAKRHLDRRNEHTGLGDDSPDLQPILSINKALLQRWTMSH